MVQPIYIEKKEITCSELFEIYFNSNTFDELNYMPSVHGGYKLYCHFS